MKVITPRRRKWTTVFLGAYLFIAPWLFGTSEDEASSTNAWIVGACIVVATLRVRVASGPRAAELARVGLGVWLLASPFALAFAGSSAAWNAWIVGTLILTLAVTSSLAFDLSSWMHAQKLRYQARRISPGMLLRFGEREEHMHSEQLCRHIVESSCQIRRTLLGRTWWLKEEGAECNQGSNTLKRRLELSRPCAGLTPMSSAAVWSRNSSSW